MRRYGLTRPYVLYNGTIEHHKNVAGLLVAFARLPPDVRGRTSSPSSAASTRPIRSG